MNINNFKNLTKLFHNYTSKKRKDHEIIDFLMLQVLSDNGYDYLIDWIINRYSFDDQDLTNLYLDLINIKGFRQDEFYLNVDIAVTKLLEKVDTGFKNAQSSAISTGMSLITTKDKLKKYELQLKIETNESQFLENSYIESTSFDKIINK